MQYDPKEFKKYPEVMSKEQLYKVCHIAKRTATYLLQSGLIPNTYTGKQTRCYQIKKNDVIAFLEDREVNPDKYILPKFLDNTGKKNPAYKIRILPGEAFSRAKIRAFYENDLKREKDVLTVADVVRITGYRRTTVSSWVNNKRLNGFLTMCLQRRIFAKEEKKTLKKDMKPQTLLVDFNPQRMFYLQETKSRINNINTEDGGNEESEKRIKRDLEVSPIIHISENKLVEVKPTDILKAVSEYSVNRGITEPME